MKIAIVVDMWLIGFDVPSMATMYIYKPMQGHNLMQAIARVNRVFEDKEGGLIVDYVGIASALKEAMNDYTSRDKKNYGDTDVAKVAYPKFLEKLSICRDFFYRYDYSVFMSGTDLERSKAITGAVNFIIAVDKEKERDAYINEELIAITKELAETLRKNRTIDWQKRDSARAKMRMMIKKLLKEDKIVSFPKKQKVTYRYEPQEMMMVAEETTPYGKKK